MNSIIDSIDHVISDQSFSRNSVRVSILLLGNLYHLSKTTTKYYLKRKSTYQKLSAFFELERENMTDDELIELEKILKNFYSPRELFGLTKR